jgi:dihydroorotate dehydrogenase (NAD+) catalytic subunit
MTAEDALEFLIAGARAVAIGTANFINPTAAVKVIEGLEQYCAANGIPDIRQLIGTLQIPGGGDDCVRSSK